MGGDNKTSTTVSQSSNPAITQTVSKLASGLSNAYDAGSPGYFDKSLYQPAGATTQQGWNSTLGAANNPAYNAGVSGATADFADAAAGNQYGANDAYYKQLGDDSLRDVNAMFTTSGRFGSGSHVGTAVKALGDVNNANIAADRAWQTQAAGALPGLYNASLLPGATIGAVGGAQDANASGILQGENELWNRKANANTDWLAKLTSILGGNAASAGTSSTSTTPSTPLWQSLLGLGVGLA